MPDDEADRDDARSEGGASSSCRSRQSSSRRSNGSSHRTVSQVEANSAAFLRWLESPDSSYTGMCDRLVLGHRVLQLTRGHRQRRQQQQQQQHADGEAGALQRRLDAAQLELVAERERALSEHAAERERALSELAAERERALSEHAAERERALSELAAERERAAELGRALERERAELAFAAERQVEAERARAAERERALERERAAERARAAEEHAAILARTGQEHSAMMARLADVGDAGGRLSAAVARIDGRDGELRAMIGQLGNSLHSAEVQRLRAELERLRGSNHVKGARGEAAVMAAMRDAFDSWSFADTSSRGSESDFHMTSPTGEVVVVEVKNKATVTAADVAKSLRDVAELAERMGSALLAYVFVSLRSVSIPGKGALLLELQRHGVAVVWCGVEPPAEGLACGEADGLLLLDAGRARDVVRAARTAIDVGRAVARLLPPPPSSSCCPAAEPGQEQEQEQEQQQLQQQQQQQLQRRLAEAQAAAGRAAVRINDHLSRIDGMRRVAARLEESVSATRRHVATLNNGIDAAFRDLDAFVIEEGVAARPAADPSPTPAPAPAPAPVPAPTCEACGKAFATSKGVRSHARSCPARLTLR
jgi:hypothetical protein